jgi:hypothetical protein
MQTRQFENLKRRAEAVTTRAHATESQAVLQPDAHSHSVGLMVGANAQE